MILNWAGKAELKA